ncbi:lysozyme [Chryseobacterium indoltheticum]|uniref:Lysozyme n=1 Tax=Chryseobacterium indoltheticum TaxID=254 RepID=A0A381FGI3_9FLAO|nr:lysozyme [Chryseobacterium indoltheticum]AZA74550.1 hypothetical protein EG358_12605 [Chryseobacterium indoltheticum]SIQ08672.1 lysozyme [Chryseobacterium indoltheticum]SUX45568.1 Phage-related lysozyme (muraminidase) [Chryseobacterium indoltheticum]
MDKNLCKKAVDFVCDLEGFKEYAYKDSGGVWTVGYGQTYFSGGKKVMQYDKIGKTESILFVQKKVEKIYYNIVKRINRTLPENQYVALISFVYNVGETAFNRSTLLKFINMNREKIEIISEFKNWVYVKGVFVQGLLNRRLKESSLYFQEKIGELF